MALYFTIKKTFKVYLKWENYTNKKITDIRNETNLNNFNRTSNKTYSSNNLIIESMSSILVSAIFIRF